MLAKPRLLLIAAVALTWGLISNREPEIGPDPGLQSPSIVVYGRETCGYTKQMLASLAAKGIRATFRSVDDAAQADHLHARMEAAGLDTGHYQLPVVDANGQLSIRPAPEAIVEQAKLLHML